MLGYCGDRLWSKKRALRKEVCPPSCPWGLPLSDGSVSVIRGGCSQWSCWAHRRLGAGHAAAWASRGVRGGSRPHGSRLAARGRSRAGHWLRPRGGSSLARAHETEPREKLSRGLGERPHLPTRGGRVRHLQVTGACHLEPPGGRRWGAVVNHKPLPGQSRRAAPAQGRNCACSPLRDSGAPLERARRLG